MLARAERGDAIVELRPLLVGARRRRARPAGPRRRGRGRAAGRRRRCAGGAPRRAPTSRRAATSMRPHGRREADALRRGGRGDDQRLEPLERERQVRAALVGRDGVDLVDDHRAHVARAPRRPDSEVSRMKSDSGVVTRTCGGRRASPRAARAAACRRCARRRGRRGAGRSRARRASAPISASGSSRFRWTSLDSALSGET